MHGWVSKQEKNSIPRDQKQRRENRRGDHMIQPHSALGKDMRQWRGEAGTLVPEPVLRLEIRSSADRRGDLKPCLIAKLDSCEGWSLSKEWVSKNLPLVQRDNKGACLSPHRQRAVGSFKNTPGIQTSFCALWGRVRSKCVLPVCSGILSQEKKMLSGRW